MTAGRAGTGGDHGGRRSRQPNASDDADANDTSGRHELAPPLSLPCGVALKNRIVKAAMSDSLGDGEGNATKAQVRLYERWAEGGAALSLIGEVQVTPDYPEKPGNLVMTRDADLNALRRLATAGATNGAAIWPQLGHAGALSHAPISRPRGPSPLDLEGLRCEGMSLKEVQSLPSIYAVAAHLAQEVGFGGVQIHAGHGFLFSQFLSPLFNRRSDDYGGSIENRFRVIGETIDAVRKTVGPSFPIGIKINSTDKLEGGLTEEEALDVVRFLDRSSIDLIDVSGGTYFPGAPSSSEGTTTQGPYFADFAKRAKAITGIPIMATGGVKTRRQAIELIAGGSADAVGLGRAMAMQPDVARRWLGADIDPAFPTFTSPPPGGVTAWYSMRLSAIAEDADEAFAMSLDKALSAYEARDDQRCKQWLRRFHR